MAAWCTTLSVQGAITRRESFMESGARGLHVSFFFSALAAAGLMTAFVGDDYSLRYVAMHSSRNMETLYKICAFWSDSAGELLFGSLMLGGAGSIAARRALVNDHDRSRAATTVALIGLMLGAALAMTAFKANPFGPLPRIASDGRGLNPIFRNAAAAFQPPLMLLGAASAAVTFAIGMAASIAAMKGRVVGDAISARLRESALVSWSILSAALLLGAHWIYVAPGLRSFVMGKSSVMASVIAWIALTLCLIAAEVIRVARPAFSEADLMRRRAGVVLAGAGLVLGIATFAARPLTKDYDAQIGDGEQYHAKDAWGHEWIFSSQGASRLERQGDDVTSVALLPMRDGVRQPFIASESRQYYGPGGLDIYPAQAVPGIRSTIAQDLFVVLADAGDGSSVLRISFRPLVELAWTGGVLLALGGILLFWPPRAELSS